MTEEVVIPEIRRLAMKIRALNKILADKRMIVEGVTMPLTPDQLTTLTAELDKAKTQLNDLIKKITAAT